MVVKGTVAKLIQQGQKSPMPSRVAPMLCTAVKEIPGGDNYIFEVKLDGYRINAFVKNKKVRLDSRGQKDYTTRYPLIAEALQKLGHDLVLDGEVVVLDDTGRPNFNAVQLYNGKRTPINYYVFDVLWVDGYDVTELPLTGRKNIVRALIGKNEVIKFSESFDDGAALYAAMRENGWEGIVAKRKGSPYLQNDRSFLWLKIPVKRIDEFVIGGWAESDKARAFRSILFGAYTYEGFKWVGRSGGGFKEEEMPGILKELRKREIKESPFYNKVLDTKGAIVHWVRQELVGLFEYSEMTESGRIRKPATWKGFRWDKDPKQVRLPEIKELSSTTKKESKPSPGKKTKNRYLNSDSNWKLVDKEQENAEWQEIQLENCKIQVHDLEREIWPGLPKGKLIIYYNEVSQYILPYLQDRPLSLHLKLKGANVTGFYIKDIEKRQPLCASIFTDRRRHAAEGKRNLIDYLVCNNKETLLWMIDLGCIDINPWNSRTANPEKPDWIVIDLDPSEKKSTTKGLTRLQNTAMAAKAFCDQHKLKAFAKTSGKTGLHFLIPCSGFHTKEVRALGEKICAAIHALVPAESTLNVNKESRAGKVFVDFSQNDYADTIAAPYSVRPHHSPLVSTPLEWKEINNKLDPRKYTIEEIHKRLKKKGDLFADILNKKNAAANNKRLHAIFAG